MTRGLRQVIVWWLLLSTAIVRQCQGGGDEVVVHQNENRDDHQPHYLRRHLQGFGQPPPPPPPQANFPDFLLQMKFNFGFYDGTGLRRASDVEVVMLLGRIRAYMLDVLDFPSRHGDDDSVFGFFNFAKINWKYNKAQNGIEPSFDLSFQVYSCSRGGEVMRNTRDVSGAIPTYFNHIEMVGKYIHDYTDYTFYDVGEVAFASDLAAVSADDTALVMDCSVEDNFGMPVPYLRMTFGYFQGFARQPTAEEVLLLFGQTEKYINEKLALPQGEETKLEAENDEEAHYQIASAAGRQSNSLLMERPRYYLDHVKLVDTRWNYNPFSPSPLMLRFNLYNCARDGTPYATPRLMIKAYRDNFNISNFFSDYLHLAEFRNYSIFDLNSLNRNAGVDATDPTLLECEVSPTQSPNPTMTPPTTPSPSAVPTTAPVVASRGIGFSELTPVPTREKVVVTRQPTTLIEEELVTGSPSGAAVATAPSAGMVVTLLTILLSWLWLS